jgi:hypothetical protein
VWGYAESVDRRFRKSNPSVFAVDETKTSSALQTALASVEETYPTTTFANLYNVYKLLSRAGRPDKHAVVTYWNGEGDRGLCLDSKNFHSVSRLTFHCSPLLLRGSPQVSYERPDSEPLARASRISISKEHVPVRGVQVPSHPSHDPSIELINSSLPTYLVPSHP